MSESEWDQRILLSAIVDSSDDAIISKSLAGIITSWNKSAERLFGYTAEEVLGMPITLLIPADRLQEEPQIISRLKQGERVEHFETIRKRKDGTLIDISLTVSPVRDSSGKIVGASKIARDITESKKLRLELERAHALLEQFAYSASHDLREPLRAVQIYGEILRNKHGGQLGALGLAALQFVQDGASRMEDLLRDLLAYIQVSKFERPDEKIDAHVALETAIHTLGSNISESGAEILYQDPLPWVRMNRTHLQLLFQNLVGNAIKYRKPDVAPVVRISARVLGPYCEFSIEDNGIGIAPEHALDIFVVFRRLHGADEYPGTGLGLAICQRIVEQYDGRIWVESELSKGSVFRFTTLT